MEKIRTQDHKLSGPSREEVEAHIEEQRQLKTDQYLCGTRLSAHVGADEAGKPRTTYRDNTSHVELGELDFSRSAFGQLMNKVSVPLLFYDKCPPYLQVGIFDHFITNVPDKRFLLRKISTGDESSVIRAVLSDKYSKIDDWQVFPVVFEALDKDEDIEIQSFTYDDRISQLLIHFLDTSTHYKGTDMDAGLLVSNSETGHGAVWLEPVVTIPGCSFVNRRSLRAQQVDMRIIHKGDVDPMRIRTMAQQAKEIAQVGIVQVAEAWENRVKTAHALSYAKGIDGLPKRLFDILEEEWSKEKDLVKAEVARRIMLLAKELPLFQAVPVQQSAGQFLGLYNRYKARIGAILEEME